MTPGGPPGRLPARERPASRVRPTYMRALAGLLLLLLVGCGQAEPGKPEALVSEQPVPGAGDWVRLEDSPLSPREASVAAYVDGKAVFVGGNVTPCPPNADCVLAPFAPDGAAYDPKSRSWEPIPDPPVSVPPMSPRAVVDAHLFVLVHGKLLDYDAARDRWATTKVPSSPTHGLWLTADGSRLVLASGSDERGEKPDRVLDTRTAKWSVLPDDPFALSFDRMITATDEGLVLTAKAIDAHGNPAEPGLVRAALLPRWSDRWRKLPTSDQIGGWRWAWTGERLVDPTLGGANGGKVNGYGRTIPYGGALDPATGTWSRLPDAPRERTGGWPVEALDGPVIAVEGWLYDDAAGTWDRLRRPKGAPPEPGVGVWAGDTLLVLGGTDWRQDRVTASSSEKWTAERIFSTGLWAHRPD